MAVDLLGHWGPVAQDDVQQPIAAQRQTMRSTETGIDRQHQQRLHLVRESVSVLVVQSVDTTPVRTVARDVHGTVQAENPVAVFDLVGINADLVRFSVALAVVDQQQLASLARGDDVPELVEGQGEQ